jgi:hypothetical protein
MRVILMDVRPSQKSTWCEQKRSSDNRRSVGLLVATVILYGHPPRPTAKSTRMSDAVSKDQAPIDSLATALNRTAISS